MGNIWVETHIYAGTSIDNAAEDILDLSKKLGVSIRATFNGIEIYAHPNFTVQKIIDNYFKDLDFERKNSN